MFTYIITQLYDTQLLVDDGAAHMFLAHNIQTHDTNIVTPIASST